MFCTDWELDAARRDFTVNAMSLASDGQLFDYYRGQADLSAKIVRFIGDPDARIKEDYLRIIRYCRFYSLFATMGGDTEHLLPVKAAITNNLTQLSQLSP